MDYYIFRHGETYFSKNEILYGDAVESAEILPEGIPTIKKLADYLKDIKTDINFTSPYLRCRQTTEIISKETGWKFNVDQRLHDLNRQIETVSDMIKRVQNFWEELEQTNHQKVAICTHGYPISALIQLNTKGFVSEPMLNNYPKTGVLTIVKDKKVEPVDFT
jgi:broad specificity phosphatase PhoE